MVTWTPWRRLIVTGVNGAGVNGGVYQLSTCDPILKPGVNRTESSEFSLKYSMLKPGLYKEISFAVCIYFYSLIYFHSFA